MAEDSIEGKAGSCQVNVYDIITPFHVISDLYTMLPRNPASMDCDDLSCQTTVKPHVEATERLRE